MLFAAFFLPHPCICPILAFTLVMLQQYPAHQGPRASTLVHWALLKL